MSMWNTSPGTTAVTLLTALLSAYPACASHAQSRALPGAIDGVVTDTNLVSLSDATATILGSTIHVSTGVNGRFRITGLQPREYILVIHRLGYKPSSIAMQIGAADTLRMSFMLQPIVTALDTVSIVAQRYSARMGEFEERRKQGFGHFVTTDDIERLHAVFLADVLRTVVSVGIADSMSSQVAINMRGMSDIQGGSCAFQVYLDHVLMPSPTNLMDLPSPGQIAGVEVYSGPATIPLQYKNTRGSFCGVILLWTKDGS